MFKEEKEEACFIRRTTTTMTRGRKPKCFGNFTNSDEINRIYGVKWQDVNAGWEDAGFYCLTLCKHSGDCMEKRQELIDKKEPQP